MCGSSAGCHAVRLLPVLEFSGGQAAFLVAAIRSLDGSGSSPAYAHNFNIKALRHHRLLCGREQFGLASVRPGVGTNRSPPHRVVPDTSPNIYGASTTNEGQFIPVSGPAMVRLGVGDPD